MQQKLGITCIEHFALVLQNSKGVTQNKMMLLRETESLAEVSLYPPMVLNVEQTELWKL